MTEDTIEVITRINGKDLPPECWLEFGVRVTRDANGKIVTEQIPPMGKILAEQIPPIRATYVHDENNSYTARPI